MMGQKVLPMSSRANHGAPAGADRVGGRNGQASVEAPGEGLWAAERVEDLVSSLVTITAVEADGTRGLIRGRPRPDAEAMFEEAARAAHERGFDLSLMTGGSDQAVVAVTVRDETAPALVEPAMGRAVLQWSLLVATLVTTIWAGAMHQGVNLLVEPARWMVGLPYAVALLAILGVHELGHYFVARRRGVAVTLPYFIPAPLYLGTFGAFIRMRGVPQDRASYFDVGIAGPLAGLVVAAGAVIAGTALGGNVAIGHGMRPGSSALFYVLYLLGGGSPGAASVTLGPIAFAGWLGLLITALNLVPAGQLDGGHIAYAVLGRERARSLALVIVGLMVAAGFLYSHHWLVWALLVWFVAGVDHPPARNELAPVGRARLALAALTLVILLATVLPWPLRLPGLR